MSQYLDARLEHVFDVQVFFSPDRTTFGPLPGGYQQGYTPPTGGTITGPRLTGTVVPNSGADYALLRADGVLELNAHYMLQAEDGSLIYIQNVGYLITGGGGGENDQGLEQPTYFKFAPKFRVAEGPHDWLMRTVIVGAGERRRDPDHSIFRYYAVL